MPDGWRMAAILVARKDGRMVLPRPWNAVDPQASRARRRSTSDTFLPSEPLRRGQDPFAGAVLVEVESLVVIDGWIDRDQPVEDSGSSDAYGVSVLCSGTGSWN